MAIDPTIATNGMFRIWIQDCRKPTRPFEYYGCVQLDGLGQGLGDRTPIYCPSPNYPDTWDVVATVKGQPELPTADLTWGMNKYMSDLLWQLKRTGQSTNFLMSAVEGTKQPDALDSMAGAMMLIDARLGNLNVDGALNPQAGDGNSRVNLTGTVTGQAWDEIKTLQFEEQAAATVLAEIMDVLFSDAGLDEDIRCDVCERMYALAVSNTGSPGLSAQIVVTLNDGSSYSSVDINSLGGSTARRFAVMGNRLVVISPDSGSHHWSTIDNVDAGTPMFTEVSSGYTTAPRCIYVKSSFKAFIGGVGGYIYELNAPNGTPTTLTDGSVAAQDVNDIDGLGDVVVAAANNNAVLYSDNLGDTFSAVTGPEAGQNLTAVAVLSSSTWFVGTGNGNLYYTTDKGTSWTESTPDSDLAVINRIKFDENKQTGFLCAQTAGAGRVYRSLDMGHSWERSEPYLSAPPTAERYQGLAICNLNKIAVGGKKQAATDGLLVIAE